MPRRAPHAHENVAPRYRGGSAVGVERGRETPGAACPPIPVPRASPWHHTLSPPNWGARTAQSPTRRRPARPRASRVMEGGVMDVLYERCCGLDIHKKTVVACLVT